MKNPASRSLRFLQVRGGVLPAALVLAVIALQHVGAHPAQAQLAPVQIRVRGGQIISGDEPASSTSGDKDFPHGPSLSTDTEIERYLHRASEYIRDKRFDLATVALQTTLDEQHRASRGGALLDEPMSLISREEWKHEFSGDKFQIYRSVNEHVERMLRSPEMGAAGLAVYRLSVDGRAKGLLAADTPEKLERNLGEVIWRYFMSSYGDDAAYRLGCLLIEKRDYVGASRLLRKILEEHPDVSISRDQIALRLALCDARLGDADRARGRLAQLRESSAKLSPAVLALVEGEVDRAAVTSSVAAQSSWRMPYGSPSRRGVQASLPFLAKSTSLEELWPPLEFDLGVHDTKSTASTSNQAILLNGRISARYPVQTTSMPSREQLLERWKSAKWFPSGRVLNHKGVIYFKTYGDLPPQAEGYVKGNHPQVTLQCWDPATGKFLWPVPDGVVPTEVATSSQSGRYFGNSLASQNDSPRSFEEVMLFGDRTNHEFSISADDVVYTLESKRLLEQDRRSPQYLMSLAQGGAGNELYAFDAHNRSGKLMGHRGGDLDPETNTHASVRFMAAPVPFGDLIIAPVRDGNSLWLYGMRPEIKQRQSGESSLRSWSAPTVWKTFLCDVPASGISPHAVVGVSVEGGDVYVASGAGVVFAVDAAAGAIRWAVRYQRDVTQAPNVYSGRGFGFPGYGFYGNVNGFDDNVVIPHGRYLVLIPSDTRQVYAFDRRTGEVLWKFANKVEKSNYYLGVIGDRLILGGADEIRCHGIAKGEGITKWVAPGSYTGRGIVTADGVLAPSGNSVIRIGLESGKRESDLAYAGSDATPLGNLHSDGRHLISLGMDRLTVLASPEVIEARLAKRIEAGDVDALLERMRVRARKGEFDKVADDLRAAVVATAKTGDKQQALKLLVDQIEVLKLPAKSPRTVLDLLARASVDWTAAEKQVRDRHDRVIYASLQGIGDGEVPGVVPIVLKVIPQCEPAYLLTAAETTLRKLAGKTDAAVLRESLKDAHPHVRAIAASSLAAVLAGDAAADLKPLLADQAPRVRMAAARALADVGARESLDALAALLDSDDELIRAEAVSALRTLTGRRMNFAPLAAAGERAKQAAEWRTWIAGDGRTAKLNHPLGELSIELGRTLISLSIDRKIIELDHNGKAIELLSGTFGPCQGLPNGHRLIGAEQQYVVELDRAGKETGQRIGLPSAPLAVQRLPSGNTIVAVGGNSYQLLEFNPTGAEQTLQITLDGLAADVQRLENGFTLVALAERGRVVEINEVGTEQWQVDDLKRPRSVQRLANGNTLVAEEGADRVVEINREGKVVRTFGDLRSPKHAQRLPGGSTIIADAKGLRELDAQGKTLWSRDMPGISRIHRY